MSNDETPKPRKPWTIPTITAHAQAYTGGPRLHDVRVSPETAQLIRGNMGDIAVTAINGAIGTRNPSFAAAVRRGVTHNICDAIRSQRDPMAQAISHSTTEALKLEAQQAREARAAKRLADREQAAAKHPELAKYLEDIDRQRAAKEAAPTDGKIHR